MIATLIIALILVVIVAFIIKKMIKDKLQGKSSCCGDCEACGGVCHAFDTADKISKKKVDLN